MTGLTNRVVKLDCRYDPKVLEQFTLGKAFYADFTHCGVSQPRRGLVPLQIQGDSMAWISMCRICGETTVCATGMRETVCLSCLQDYAYECEKHVPDDQRLSILTACQVRAEGRRRRRSRI